MKCRILITLIISFGAARAGAIHTDIFITQQTGELITGRGASDPGSGGSPRPGVRYHVNDIAGLVPFVDNNPGFSAAAANTSFFLSGTYQPLPASSTLGFNLRAFRVKDGPAANLFYWDGFGEVSFNPVKNPNDYLQVRAGTGLSTLNGEAIDVAGFDFTATDPQGAIHSHLTFDFDVDNNAGTPTSTGVFLAALEFAMELTGDATREISRPHYVAWFNGPPGSLKTNSMAATNSFMADQFAELRLLGDVSPPGDDDLPDDLVTADDIDALLAAINLGATDLIFDLNSDTQVNADDVGVLFDVLGTEYGDANLDGQVNAADLVMWQENYGTTGGWTSGDFNGDFNVNGRDFLTWQRHAGFGSILASGVAVPEPGAVTTASFAICILVLRRHRGHKAYRGVS